MFARIALVIALLFPSLASADDALKFADSPQLATAVVTQELGDAPDQPSDTHVIAVHAADGDTYTVHQALDATIDGKPILLAQADTGSAATDDTGSAVGSATLPPSTTPADQLHDPLSNPAAALDDAKQSRRQGWPIFAFALGVLAAKLLGNLGKRKNVKWLAWMNVGRAAVAIGGFSAFVVAGYNALADGGSLYAGLFAGAIAVASWWNSHAGDGASGS